MSVEVLRAMAVFSVLDDGEIAHVAAAGTTRDVAAGEVLFRQGDRATVFQVVLEGRLETTRDVAGDEVLMIEHGVGGYLGATALLTDTPYRGTTRAVTAARLLELPGAELRRLAFVHPALLRALLPTLESVSGAVKGIERDREKQLAVGKLAAGLAHELNNPAAAAARGVSTLRELERRRQAAFAEIAPAASAAQLAALASLGVEATARTVPGEPLDPLAESDREQELADALERRGCDDPFGLAASMVEAGMDAEWVERVALGVGEAGLSPGLRFVAACAGTRVLLAEVEEAVGRISAIVGAVRDYAHLDQAPRQEVDVHEGLESTLSMLAHALRDKRIEIVRRYDRDIPRIEVAASELNQVWTNLIDNAIDALPDGGRITLSTGMAGDRLCVEIADDGPGIPDDVRGRVFDPFFTTKPVGQGAGLGLDIARRIVTRHHGEIRLRSEPGDTRVEVILPVT